MGEARMRRSLHIPTYHASDVSKAHSEKNNVNK